MKITDLLPLEAWEQLEREIHERFGLNAAVSDEKGVRITKYANWGNRLCPEIKGNPQGLAAICAVAGQHFTSQCQQTLKPFVDQCDAGMVKIAVPVVAGGEYLGSVGGCGKVKAGEEVDEFMINKSTPLGEARVAELAKGVKPITGDEAQAVVAFIQKRLDELLA
ncbi:MAG: PocR ligand-binding domain-containing protein [Desulfovibrionaceae bacterium]|nr:PocR ligand-binding domain-containing protein [Desulfovibrionaceae bacterium]